MKKVRDRIIDSATHLFSEKGYHGVSVNDITSHARTNVSLVSFYFGGKKGLLNTLLGNLVAARMTDLQKVLVDPQSIDDFRLKLKTFLEKLSEFYTMHSELLRIHLQELESGNTDAELSNSSILAPVWTHLLTFLETAQEKNIFVTIDCRVSALQILGPFTSLMRNRNSAHRFCNISLADETFRKNLIHQVVELGTVHLSRHES